MRNALARLALRTAGGAARARGRWRPRQGRTSRGTQPEGGETTTRGKKCRKQRQRWTTAAVSQEREKEKQGSVCERVGVGRHKNGRKPGGEMERQAGERKGKVQIGEEGGKVRVRKELLKEGSPAVPQTAM